MSDLISRQAAMDALNNELRCGAVINQCGLEMAYEVIEGLPSAQPEIKQQVISSSDCIDRRAAIDALDSEITITGRTNAAVVMGYCKLVKDRLERLPSAQPKKGKWIIKDDTEKFIAQCNCCRYIEDSRRINNFCPHCGADMREVTE